MEKPLKKFFVFPELSTFDNVYRPPAPKKKKQFDVSLLWPLAGQKLLFYVEGYLDFTPYSNLFIYLFIPRFLVEHLTTLCINLVGKHWVFDMGFAP
jgi:hypothetical protein